MRWFFSTSLDPYWNLALEKYFLEESTVDIVLLYVNKPCVVVGKNQNNWKEADLLYAEKHNILVARRVSGGGTVYHDEGNVNYAFIGSFGQQASAYTFFLSKVTSYLNQYLDGVSVGAHNALYFNTGKISGSAKAVKHKRILQHGTLLFNANLSILHRVLQCQSSRVANKRKGVQSNPANTINIGPFLPFDSVAELLYDARLYLTRKKLVEYRLSENDITRIEELYAELASNAWIYGRNPEYAIQSMDDNGVELLVRKGIISEIRGGNATQRDLLGRYHTPKLVVSL